ncbi:hypothetical protein A33K_13533 [Burkholderia humptydooensis MSMB43]|uniref:Uncharacterized protein n=1 Tax=Burkholderia humptydooensis MSMB43 TaxID=441157 RepID=A0ABN0GCI1_9BURK|nr:hypothetical protein A33K_13533 [Burkholderia humptydooensis MSMB43]
MRQKKGNDSANPRCFGLDRTASGRPDGESGARGAPSAD